MFPFASYFTKSLRLVFLHSTVHKHAAVLASEVMPFVLAYERERVPQPDLWYSPYRLGVVGAMVEAYTQQTGMDERESVLGAMQTKVWEGLARQTDPCIGERMARESLMKTSAFGRGWAAGAVFFEILMAPERFSLHFTLEDSALTNTAAEEGETARDPVSRDGETWQMLSKGTGELDPRIYMAWKIIMDAGRVGAN